jgi:hypothetical protein
MMKPILSILLLLFAANIAQAGPIVFTDVEYTAYALADVDGVSDGPYNKDSTSFSLPFSVSASTNNVSDAAAASAGADVLALSANSSASSALAPASASAVSTFTGHFVAPDGLLSLSLDFSSLASGFSQLDVALDLGGTLLYSQSFTASDLFNGSFAVPVGLAGTEGLLDITLTSLADASNLGDSFANQSAVRFSLNQVPEPAVWADLMLGLLLLAFHRRQLIRRAES